MALIERRQDARPWGWIAVLALVVLASLSTVPLQVETLRGVRAASSQDVERARVQVERNRQLVEQVQQLERQTAQDVEQHRSRNEAVHGDQCRLLEAIARTLGAAVTGCREPLDRPGQPR